MGATRRVAVLGANGQLGAEFRRLHAAGADWELIPLGRTDFDALDPASVERRLGALAFDVLVNCVAATRVDDCETDCGRATAVNARFPAAVARACARRSAKMVQVSTDYVFGGGRARSPLDEAAPRAPVNVYGATKAMGEDLARLEHDRVVVVRVASLFGTAGASGKGGNFVETMLRLGREPKPLRVVTDQHMSPTYAVDAAGAILALALGDAEDGVWHAVNSGDASWWEFACEIARLAGFAAPVEPIASAAFPTPARRPAYSVLDNRKLLAAGVAMGAWPDALRRYMREREARAATDATLAPA